MSLKDKVVKIAYELKDKFSGRVGKITSSIKAVGTQSDATTAKVERNNKRSIASFKGLATGIKVAVTAALALGGAIVTATAKFFSATDNIGKLSTRLGISTEALSQLKHVAELSGVSFQTMTLGLQRMTRRVSEAANGTGEAKAAIEELGLSAIKLNSLSPDKQFEMFAEAISKIENPADRVRIAMKLFDTEGVALIQTMTGGAAGIRAMRKEADDFGLTLKGGMVDAVQRTNDSLTRVKSAMEGVFLRVMAEVLPQIEGFVKGMVAWAKESSNLENAVASLSAVLKTFGTIGTIIGGVLTTVGKSLGGIAAAVVATVQGDFSRAASIIDDTFSDVVDTVVTTSDDVVDIWSDATKDVVDASKDLDKVGDKAEEVGRRVVGASKKTAEQIEAERLANLKAAEAAKARAKALKKALKDSQKALSDDLDKAKDITSEFQNLINEMQSGPDKAAEDLTIIDFAASITNARQALNEGDFDGAISGAGDTAAMLRQMKEAGIESELVLTGLAQQLKRVAEQAAAGKSAAQQGVVASIQQQLQPVADNAPIQQKLILDTTEAKQQLDALVQQASAPIVKKIFISADGTSFSDRPISAAEAIKQEARKKGSR